MIILKTIGVWLGATGDGDVWQVSVESQNLQSFYTTFSLLTWRDTHTQPIYILIAFTQKCIL